MALPDEEHFQCLNQRHRNVLLKVVQRLFFCTTVGGNFFYFFTFQKVQEEKREKAVITFLWALFANVRKICTFLPDHDLERTLSLFIIYTFRCTPKRNVEVQALGNATDPYLDDT